MANKRGQAEISTLLLQSITSICISDIEGIKPIGPRLFGRVSFLLQQEQRQSAIIQLEKGNSVSLDVIIAIAYNTCIPDACRRLQQHIKKEIEVLTGYRVNSVHVFVGEVYRS